MISKRLLSLVKYIDSEDKVIDVGCDHALLDIYLVKHDFLKSIIVSDVHENALNSGIENIKREGLEKVVSARLGNGLEVLNEREVDTLLISGMGTNTILKILDSKHTKNLKKIIIQSNNDHYLLRKSICDMGFKISDECFIFDSDKYYINIVFIRGNYNYTTKELKYGPFLMKVGSEYYKHEKSKLESIYKTIPNENKAKQEMLNKIKELEEII